MHRRSVVLGCLAVALTALGWSAKLRGDAPYDLGAARHAVASAFGVPDASVTGEWEGVPLHVRCFGLRVAGDGFTARVLIAPEWRRIVQVEYDYAPAYKPDRSWAAMRPEEALTVHLTRLGMSVPEGVRLAELLERRAGSANERELRYRRADPTSPAPLWLGGTLGSPDNRPIRLTSLDYPLAVDPHPAISRDEAIAIATGRTPEAKRGETETDLRAWFRADESQVLWWDVTVHSGNARSCGVRYLIDAHSGAVDHVIPF